MQKSEPLDFVGRFAAKSREEQTKIKLYVDGKPLIDENGNDTFIKGSDQPRYNVPGTTEVIVPPRDALIHEIPADALVYTWEELLTLVQAWGKEKGIMDAPPEMQYMKMIEEIGEAASNLFRYIATEDKKYLQLLKDDIGDGFVTMILLAGTLDLDPVECLNIAYAEISGRKGASTDSGFIKEEDL